jgi:hypothetical protein
MVQVIFDNFAKILRHCLKGTTQDIPEVVNDTRIVWEMCLQAELEVGSLSSDSCLHVDWVCL